MDHVCLTALFVWVKLVHVAIISCTHSRFDILSQILLNAYKAELVHFGPWTQRFITLFLNKLVTWDAVYFADLFVKDILYEHQFVFCPLWWRAVRLVPGGAAPFYRRLMWATALANGFHFLAVFVMYHYTWNVFLKARVFSPRRMALGASALYILTPAAAFMTAPYLEPGAAFCSLMCLLLREWGIHTPISAHQYTPILRRVSYLAAGVFAALAFGFRANCLLLGAVFLWDLYFGTVARVYPIIAGLFLGLGLVSAQVHGFYAVCHDPFNGVPRGEWCDAMVPSLFAYAQDHYWNVGFLRYWTPGNVPNFLLAAPTIVLSVVGVRYFSAVYPVARAMPVMAANLGFVGLLLLFWHVQIATRIHTFLPVVYWVVAGFITQGNGTFWARLAVGYFVVWNLIQPSLFGAFLPPA